jgi:hypothetical protein
MDGHPETTQLEAQLAHRVDLRPDITGSLFGFSCLQQAGRLVGLPTLPDPTLADSILDRPVRNAHRNPVRGKFMRKKRPAEPTG